MEIEKKRILSRNNLFRDPFFLGRDRCKLCFDHPFSQLQHSKNLKDFFSFQKTKMLFKPKRLSSFFGLLFLILFFWIFQLLNHDWNMRLNHSIGMLIFWAFFFLTDKKELISCVPSNKAINLSTLFCLFL